MSIKNQSENQGDHKIIESPLITIAGYGGIGLCLGRAFINIYHTFNGTETPLALSSEIVVTLAGALLGLGTPIISPGTHDKVKYALAGVFLGLAASFYPEKNNIAPIGALAVMAAITLILGHQPAAHE